jgi:hypothetical protein
MHNAPYDLQGGFVQGARRERWLELCEKAANEHDPQKLLMLVEEINRLLEEKSKRLAANKPADSVTPQ